MQIIADGEVEAFEFILVKLPEKSVRNLFDYHMKIGS